jgi:uncharacterized protein YjbI with pentapeptide repeats
MVGADLIGADLTALKIIGGDWSYVIFRHNNLSGFDLRGIKFTGADFYGCNLKEVDFGESDLSCAVLTKAKISGANLRGAKIAGIDFKNIDLKGVHLDYMQAGTIVESLGALIE